MNINKFFDYLLSSISETAGGQYKVTDRDKLAKCRFALQAFMQEPTELRKKIQAMTVSTDLAQVAKDAFNVFTEVDNFDNWWERAFRVVPVAKGEDSWEIHTISNGLMFRKYEEGQRARVEGFTSAKQTVTVDKYGGALGWTDEMIRFRKIAVMLDRMETFRNRYWENKADNHYALLAAGAAGNITTYQGAAADGQLQRDIKTINRACYDIGNANKDKGYGDTANARFVMYINPILKTRIEAAFAATTQALAQAGRGGEVVGYNVDRYYTYNSNLGTTYGIIVLPGNKLQRADVMMPTSYEDFDILQLTYIQAIWSYYGAAVGDTDQTRRLNFV